MVSWRVNFPHKNGSTPFWIAPPSPPHIHTHDNFKISPKLYAVPSPINITNMIRQHREFPPTARSLGKPDQQAIHCPTANFGPLSRDSVTNPMLITVFDNYLTPRSSRAWVWVKILIWFWMCFNLILHESGP